MFIRAAAHGVAERRREMRILVTGGAGFIGSHLAEALLREGHDVVVLDNLSVGRREYVPEGAELVVGDIIDRSAVSEALRDVDAVFHYAANPEVRIGDPDTHLKANVLGTYTVLEEMRRLGVRDIVFASTSTVYGEASQLPTPESYGPMKPISVYGASKLACEALISSYTHTYDFHAVALRYANVVGPRAHRGVIKDFVAKLRRNPRVLEILGDGTQTKSYIWIGDAVDATLTAWRHMGEGFEPYNVGSEDAISVVEVADAVVEALGLKDVEYRFTGGVKGGRGWIGDVKVMHLAIDKIKSLGWRPRYTSREAVALTARLLAGA